MAGKEAGIRDFQVQNSILDTEIDQGGSTDEDDVAVINILIWNPVKLLTCCGAATELVSLTHEQIPPMIASENSSDFEDAAETLLRSRTNLRGRYTRINHIRQLETWDCGRYSSMQKIYYQTLEVRMSFGERIVPKFTFLSA